MKKSIFTLALLAATCLMANATIRTVSNQTPNPGQYTTIQAAITAANPLGGDTIYIHASSIDYVGFALDRQVTIIGSGFEPSSANLNPYTKLVSGVNFYNVNASGSKIIGLYFVGGPMNFANTLGLHDVTFNRCRFDGAAFGIHRNSYNWTFTENIFFNCSFGGFSNQAGAAHDWLISNNVFYMWGSGGLFGMLGVTNLQIVNNVFYGSGSASTLVPDISSVGTTIGGYAFSNNIFNKVSFVNVSACTFSNNITNQCIGNTPWINNGTDLGVVALGTQNIAATSPNFVNQANIDAGGYGGVNWFVVNPGSPTLSSMAGDPDMGPYGGSGSYTFSKASASTLPYVYSLTIGNPTIQSGTNLNIDVIGKKHD